MSISVSGSQITFNDASTQTTAATGFGFHNRIINGDMRIDQRNAGASVTPSNSYTLDRWSARTSQASKFTVQQSSTAPSGFINSLLVTSSSAYSITSTDTFGIRQRVEGLNISDLSWGTANAKTVTLSFWVRSSLTGTFGGIIQNSAGNRSYPFSYTISSANTWEQKTITIAGDTSGTWLTTNGIGLELFFGLGVGSTLSGTAGSWAAADYNSATGATSVVGTNGATFYITGVQLEVGSTATSFDYRPYGQELALAQRYYFKNMMTDVGGSGYCRTTTQSGTLHNFPVEMRIAPTALEVTSTATDYRILNLAGATTCNAVPTFNSATKNAGFVFSTVASGLTAGQGCALGGNSANAYLAWSAEL